MACITMAQPWKHPSTGNFYYRARVPTDLIPHVSGKRIKIDLGSFEAIPKCTDFVKFSLQTKEPATARQRFSSAQAQLEAFYASIRRKARSLTHKEITYLAGQHHQAVLSEHEDDLGEPGAWKRGNTCSMTVW